MWLRLVYKVQKALLAARSLAWLTHFQLFPVSFQIEKRCLAPSTALFTSMSFPTSHVCPQHWTLLGAGNILMRNARFQPAGRFQSGGDNLYMEIISRSCGRHGDRGLYGTLGRPRRYPARFWQRSLIKVFSRKRPCSESWRRGEVSQATQRRGQPRQMQVHDQWGQGPGTTWAGGRLSSLVGPVWWRRGGQERRPEKWTAVAPGTFHSLFCQLFTTLILSQDNSPELCDSNDVAGMQGALPNLATCLWQDFVSLLQFFILFHETIRIL